MEIVQFWVDFWLLGTKQNHLLQKKSKKNEKNFSVTDGWKGYVWLGRALLTSNELRSFHTGFAGLTRKGSAYLERALLTLYGLIWTLNGYADYDWTSLTSNVLCQSWYVSAVLKQTSFSDFSDVHTALLASNELCWLQTCLAKVDTALLVSNEFHWLFWSWYGSAGLKCAWLTLNVPSQSW